MCPEEIRFREKKASQIQAKNICIVLTLEIAANKAEKQQPRNLFAL